MNNHGMIKVHSNRKSTENTCLISPLQPNQQRTLKLPTELQHKKFVNKHRLSRHKSAPNVQKRVCIVYMFQLSFHFAYDHWWLGGHPSKKKTTTTERKDILCFLHSFSLRSRAILALSVARAIAALTHTKKIKKKDLWLFLPHWQFSGTFFAKKMCLVVVGLLPSGLGHRQKKRRAFFSSFTINKLYHHHHSWKREREREQCYRAPRTHLSLLQSRRKRGGVGGEMGDLEGGLWGRKCHLCSPSFS